MIEFRNLTKKRIRTKIFKKLGNKIFPKQFELSVVFAPSSVIKALNKRYLNKNKPANTLSFLLERRRGEIFLNAKEQKLPFLFVHSALHLLGFNHKRNEDTKKMKERELKILKSK
ncbi:hypothetical protein A2926_00765 [Candidatus Giovannonibacteria bacterium RIFCSPLOWO2_01_FULL_44_40]|uniref:Uncharacterized protein n=1 Tax=Candidatus Giovannonibacteria bacterium RIFCSPHIGHO2_01_FULL_45_23 TaxID=1798325 RepID=A0A1F5VER1_9BACT|nr:MAG: hypothetical protein A2834_00270 [Candidatus Giovannonibacteria bacterium RIFCSPHIGHO2_01_FULL_45_23]OGF76484.1 MAG: hypothetical protein A3C77_02980 [Candidatus Giovannonibacteria bacterium RIFCSPHIGHO2_02_FULL_45_13]OGF79611.1 MAG: hypothetical protein A2926_00765 [Candidatus Giovannonibacteria bacterium RIFCSPLOWO2_01_FULL_44_40]